MIKVLGNRVLILPDPIPEKTSGGIFRPDTTVEHEKYHVVMGTIKAIGDYAWQGFFDSKPWAKVGDRVVYAKYGGMIVEDNKIQYRLLNDEDIMAIVEDES